MVFDNYCLKHSSESRATNRSGYAYGLLNNPKALSINNKKYSNTSISETKILPQKTGAEEKKRKGGGQEEEEEKKKRRSGNFA